MRYPLGYKVLRTYQQGMEVYNLTKKFTADFLSPMRDSRLIGHMNDSARSVPRNISEGYGRNNTKQYYEFLGFSFGSLNELLEDYLSVEGDIKGGLRKTRDDEGALRIISQAIKLCMGEKTMLKSQMDKMGVMAGEQGLISQNQRDAKMLMEETRENKELDQWLEEQIRMAKEDEGGQRKTKEDDGELGKTKEDKGEQRATKGDEGELGKTKEDEGRQRTARGGNGERRIAKEDEGEQRVTKGN